MTEKQELQEFYFNLANEIQLSATARKTVETTFDSIKELIKKQVPDDTNITIFPQGSCSLGTTIKPLQGSDDDFDVDLVVAVKKDDLDAETLKWMIGNILLDSPRYKEKVSEKGRAWGINYANSHLDVVPAKLSSDGSMHITDKNDDGGYSYVESNPQELTNWFLKKCQKKSSTRESEISTKPIHVYTNHYVLQKVVQILKYHRNLFCKDWTEKNQPISMLITIIAAELYNNETDLFEATTNIVSGILNYLKNHFQNGVYKISNPVNDNEVFTDKWIEHPERKDAFIKWVRGVYDDLIYNALNDNRLDYAKRMEKIFNESAISAYKGIGLSNEKDQHQGNMTYDTKNGLGFGKNQWGDSFDKNTFWGN